MIYTERYKAYDREYNFIGEDFIYLEMIHKMIDAIPIGELKKLIPMEKWDDAEPRGKPGPVLHRMRIQIEIQDGT